MQTSGQRAERTDQTQSPRPVRGRADARHEMSGGTAAVPPPLTADALRAAQSGMGNAAVTLMIARRARPAASPEQLDPGVHEVLRSAGKPLDGPVRQEMESRFGTEFSGVRMHTGAAAARSARAIGARAYTSGSHVVLGDGGGDKHTLAHELTHVVQQRSGPVAGTDQGNGLSVSHPSDRFEREAETNAHRVMTGPVPVRQAAAATESSSGEASARQTADGEVSAAAPTVARRPARTPVVQRKGHEELSGKLPSPASGTSVSSFLKSFSLRPAQDDPVVAGLRKDIEAYDSDPKRDPAHCLQQLMALLLAVSSAEDDRPAKEGGAVKDFLIAARQALRAEKDVVTGQMVRDNQFPADARGPFEAMTGNGMLWNEDGWADSAVAFAMSGPSYFRELSEINRAGMAKEIAGRGSRGWVDNVKKALETALKQSVLCHYTSQDRADQLVQQGTLKSKTALLRENPDAPNNSEAYDKHVLANEGFVFFFLEAEGSEPRGTRFGKVRIEIPLDKSPLESQGWLMLSDFAQREYPTIHAHAADPADTASKLPTRHEAFAAEFSVPVRNFDLGAGRARMDDDKLMTRMGREQEDERRGQILFAMTQAAADPHSEMTYGSDEGRKAYPEKLRSNTLRGSDIVPGLVERAVLEIMRLEEVNPALANRLKGMSGPDLMKYLLKDLLRPQAMLPNTVDLSQARVRSVS
ncbi:eCIS core domain-containing protein [Streptomyces brevispora]|uniref:eCIS core domain-containing protein n=1 Tax=Streptomyces brevispora TaxID=887462 RepID=UPI003F4D4BE3